MLFRRVSIVAFAFGLAGLTACGDVHEVTINPAPTRHEMTQTIDEKPMRLALAADARRVLAKNVAAWNLTVLLNAVKENAAAVTRNQTTRPGAVPRGSTQEVSVRPAVAPSGWGPCGGAYPPCYRVGTESATAGLYNAYNPTGCGGNGCYGKWQFSGEWAGKLGLPQDLSTATPAQQDEAARLLWNNGAGCSNWSACG